MLQSTKKNGSEIVVLLAAIFVLVVHHVFAYTGHYGYDDMHYAKLANELMHGRMDFEDHYSYRWPILVLTALSFKVFGINDFAGGLPSLLASFCTLYLVFLILRPYGIKALIVGLGLTALDGWSLHYSDKIMPDVYINLAMMLLVYCIYKYKYSTAHKYSIIYPVGVALSFLFGFMAKESMLLVLPLLAYLFIVDLILKRDLAFWKHTILFAILLFLFYFGFIAFLTGSAMERFIAIYNNPYLSVCSYAQESLAILLKRISYQFFALLINTGMFIAPGIVLLYLFVNWKKDVLVFNNEQNFFQIALLIVLLSCNFMSASPTSYNPLCLDPRHYMFLIPLSALSVSTILSDHLKNTRINCSIVLVLLAYAIISYNNSMLDFKFLYVPMLLLFIVNAFLYKSKLFNSVFPYAIVLILCFKLGDTIRWAKQLDYETQKKFVIDNFISTDKSVYVITDEVQKRLGEYYNGFGMNSNTRFLKFDAFQFDTLDHNREKYLFLNSYTQQLSNLEREDLPYYASYEDTSKIVFRNDRLHLQIFKMDRLTEPIQILNFENGFENSKDSTADFKNSISNQKKFTGDYSNRIDEYSIPFKYSMDSFQFKSNQHLLIQLKLAFWKDQPSKAYIVISVDENEKPYIYESHPIDHYVKAYSNWNQAKLSELLDINKFKPGSVLKVYLWNPEKKEMSMDDFGVKLSIVN